MIGKIRKYVVAPSATTPAQRERRIEMAKDTRGIRTTAELEEILEDSKGHKTDGSWDSIHDEQEPMPDEFYLTNWLATDETFVLIFSNGHMELVGHPESGDYAHDGDMWDVSKLGWA